MKAFGVSFATAVPLGKDAMPIRELREAGLEVICGADSVTDWGDCFGARDILQKANEIARIQYRSAEFELSRALGYATRFVTPPNDKGEQVWPKAGDAASFSRPPVASSAEAVARLPARSAVPQPCSTRAGSPAAASPRPGDGGAGRIPPATRDIAPAASLRKPPHTGRLAGEKRAGPSLGPPQAAARLRPRPPPPDASAAKLRAQRLRPDSLARRLSRRPPCGRSWCRSRSRRGAPG